MATKRFDKHLHILVSSLEFVMLDELSEQAGLRPSDVVRQMIRRAHAEAFGPMPTMADAARKKLAELRAKQAKRK